MPIIQIKTSTTPGATPSLTGGELAYNAADDKLYIGNGSTSVLIKTSLGSQSASNVAITGGSINSTPIGSSIQSSVTTSNFQVNSNTPAITAIDPNPSLGSSQTSIPTQNAVASYINSKKGALKNMFTFTSSGTYTKSGTDVTYIRVVCVGAGGGAAATYGESGGAGGYAELLINAASITSVPVTVSSAGGTGGGYYGNYNSGGTTSFGSFVSATGGHGANNNQTHTGGHGGYGYGGNINAYGGGGAGHRNEYSSGNHNPGHGGASFFGGGIESGHYSQGDPWNYNNAALGAGGASTHGSGVQGQGGVCIVYEYK